MSSIGNNETCGCLNFVGAPSLIQSVSRQGKRTYGTTGTILLSHKVIHEEKKSP
jgi:hypothetical protein